MFVKCPINYIGNKYSLMKQLKPLTEKTKETIDLFGGSFTFGINSDSKKLFYNEYDTKVYELIKFLCSVEPEQFINEVEHKIKHFGLNKTDKESFKNFRKFYNESEQTEINLFILLCFSYNHQIRFNKSGKFNTPHGTGTTHFNKRMKDNFIRFNQEAKKKQIVFTNLSFEEYEIEKHSKDSLFYCDPPYLISLATYNEQNGWNPNKENSLLWFLDKIDSSGRKFALSNVTHHKGKENKLLIDWTAKKDYNVYTIDKKYRSQKTHHVEGKTQEVLVTNY